MLLVADLVFYNRMLQGIALEKEGKRGLEVVHDEREGKRARFQEGKPNQQTLTLSLPPEFALTRVQCSASIVGEA